MQPRQCRLALATTGLAPLSLGVLHANPRQPEYEEKSRSKLEGQLT